MKKLAAILLMTLYSLATMGTTIAMHYCMGDKMGVSLGYSNPDVCEYCHMEKHPDEYTDHCCKNENHFVKVTADQDIAVSSQWIKLFVAPATTAAPAFPDLALSSLFKSPAKGKLIPPEIPLYQRHCNFRI